MTELDRCRGALYGLAVGDALGQPIEFRSPGSFEPVTGYRSGGPHNLNAGEWTDDTSMALALAHSLKGGWSLNDQADRYCKWLEEGEYSVNGWCFDIGATTRQALEQYMQCKDATRSGLTEARSSGNGGIMRIAPVAIRYRNMEKDFDAAIPMLMYLGEEASSVTHASDMCRSAAAYMTVVLAALIRGQSREEALAYRPWCQHLHPAVENIVKGSYKLKHPPAVREWWPEKSDCIKGSGFVVESLEAALWAFHDAKDYREAVLKAVNLGEDSDTTGAVCGQFAGAFWGESGIPQEWLDGLARKDMIEDAFAGLMA